MKLPWYAKWIIGMSDDAAGLPIYGIDQRRIQLRIPFVPQQHVNLCGDACALMLLKFWHLDTQGVNTELNQRGVLEGSSIDELIETHNNVNFHKILLPMESEIDGEYLVSILLNFGPLICSFSHQLGPLSWGHFCVLTGVNSETGTLMLNDPWRGRDKTMPLDRFLRCLDREDGDSLVCVLPGTRGSVASRAIFTNVLRELTLP